MKILSRKAQTTLAVLVALTIIMVEVSGLISTVSINHFYNKADSVEALRALQVIDSGLEEALYRLQQDSSYAGGAITMPDGSVSNIVVNPAGGNTREIVITTSDTKVYRKITTDVTLNTLVTNPLAEIAMFGGDEADIYGDNVLYTGNIYSNDNVSLYSNAIVRGDVFSGGEGSSSYARVVGDAQVLDNPLTPEVEGNFYAIDRLRVRDDGYIEGDAVSKKAVNIQDSGFVGGNVIVDPNLNIVTQQVPTFEFDDYKTIAQTAGTYYTSPAQFLNYLSLNGNVMTGGIHFINSTSDLIFPHGSTYDITGTIVSRGDINIRANYTHVPDGDLPVLASRRNIEIDSSSSCTCDINITGVLFARRDIILDRDNYTGPGYGINITGAMWAGDDLRFYDNINFTFDEALATVAGGFTFSGGGSGASEVIVDDWLIE